MDPVLLQTSVSSIVTSFVDGIAAAVPNVLLGIVFLVLAYVGIRVVLWAVRSVLRGAFPAEEDLVVDLLVLVVGLFLWFGAALALLAILGLGAIAASLGTAIGFIGLGVAYALNAVIADTVAGVYLIRDPDIDVGMRVETADAAGTITDIDLRKTRLLTDAGDTLVLANADVEKRWLRSSGGTEAPRPAAEGVTP